MEILRGDIYMADLSPVYGSEQGGLRPVLVVQNNVGNKFSPTVIIVAITSKLHKAKIPTHVELKSTCGLPLNSIALCEQLRTIDKARLKDKVGSLSDFEMRLINSAIAISLAL